MSLTVLNVPSMSLRRLVQTAERASLGMESRVLDECFVAPTVPKSKEFEIFVTGCEY